MSIIALLVTLVIWGLIFYVLWWALGAIGLPEPFQKIATVILILAAAIVAIELLTGAMGPFPILGSLH